MGLMKFKPDSKQETESQVEGALAESFTAPKFNELLNKVVDNDPMVRRKAVNDFDTQSRCLPILIALAKREEHTLVIDAVFDKLMNFALIADFTERVVSEVVHLLFVREAKIRVQAIVFLTEFPEVVANKIPLLLMHNSHDIRLYALDIIRGLAHPDIPFWLTYVLEHEQEANVVVSAIDCAGEAGCTTLIDVIRNALPRFNDEPMVKFSVQMALERLGRVE